jgi:hypothetical protein
MAPPVASAFPYDSDLRVIADAQPDAVIRWLWPYRSILWERREPQGTHREIGFTWHQYSRFHPERFEGLGVAYAFVATHNQFVLDHGRKVFKQTAPVIKMQAGATEDEHLALLGLLNSAAACFWMKQVFHNKGIRGEGGGTTAESWEQFYEFDATKLKLFPIPSGHAAVIPWARELDRVARQRAERSIESVLAHDGWTTTAGLRAALDARREADLADLLRMVAAGRARLECYRLYGLDPKAKGRAP